MNRLSAILIMIICILYFSSCTKKLEVNGNENTEWFEYEKVSYDYQHFYCADDDKNLIGRIETGADVYTIGNNQLQYLLVEGYDNTGCFIAKGASIPTSGIITKVLIDPDVRKNNSKYLSSEKELAMLSKLTNLKGEIKQFTVDNYFTMGNSFYYVYNGSNISCEENYGGYIAHTNGKWIFSPPDKSIEWKENNVVIITGIIISDEDLINEMTQTDLTKYIK